MEYFWWLYFATRLDSFSSMFGWFIFLSVMTCIIATIIRITMVCHSDEMKRGNSDESRREAEAMYVTWMNHFKRAQVIAIAVFVVANVLYAATPTKRDAMFIAGGIGVIEAAKAVQGSEIAKKSVSVVEAWLEKELEQVKQAKPAPAPAADKQAAEDAAKPAPVNEDLKKLLVDTAKEAGRLAAKEALK